MFFFLDLVQKVDYVREQQQRQQQQHEQQLQRR